jgi:hypothetical protein
MPGSLKQIGRIDYAITGIDTPFQAGEVLGGGPLGNWHWGKIGKYNENGQSYELLDEGLGIAGMRAVKLDIPRALNYKQAAYASGTRKSKSLFTKVALKRGPRSPEELIDAYINANRALFEVQKTMGDDIRAAKLLNVKPAAMYESLKRLSSKELGMIYSGTFQPYFPSGTIIGQMSVNAQKLGLSNPFTKIQSTLTKMIRQLYKLKTTPGSKFPTFINPFKVEPVSALPKPEEVLKVSENRTPMPNNQLATANTMQVSPVTGLTVNQEALLSPDEQLIARRQNQKQGMTGTV